MNGDDGWRVHATIAGRSGGRYSARVAQEIEKGGLVLYKRLIAYAACRRLSMGLDHDNTTIPQAADLVHETYMKVLQGSRIWNPEKCSFKSFMFGTLRSIFSNECRRLKVRYEHQKEAAYSIAALKGMPKFE